MPAQRWIQFIYWQLSWMVATVLALVLFGALSYELFFLLTVLGLLVVADLTEPSVVRPRWRARVRSLVLLGLVGFVIVVVRRLLEIRGTALFSLLT